MSNIHRLLKRMRSTAFYRLMFQGGLLLVLNACHTLPVDSPLADPEMAKNGRSSTSSGIMVLDTQHPLSLQSIVPALLKKRVVFVGETHDRYDHHLNQLAVIQALYAHDPELAIGVEFFQASVQGVLDDYIAGKIDEQTFLDRTGYYDRWQYDYRLYRPIINFARDKHIPLVALNLPTEITKKVGKKGFAGLTTEEKRLLPESIDREVPGYRARIESVFHGHPGMEKRNIDFFIEAQLLWDEGMAEQAAKYLNKNISKKMVILAGAGHVMYGSGIPVRLKRRINEEVTTILTGGSFDISSKAADYVLFAKQQDLPKSGLIGVLLKPAKRGMTVGSFSPGSGAEKAGLLKGDRIISVDGRPVKKFSDIRLALWDKMPGDKVNVVIMRNTAGKVTAKHEFDVTLK